MDALPDLVLQEAVRGQGLGPESAAGIATLGEEVCQASLANGAASRGPQACCSSRGNRIPSTST